MFKIQYSPQALDDLKRLQVYILTNWGDSISKKILTKITSDIIQVLESDIALKN